MPFAIVVSALLQIVRFLLAVPFWCAVLQMANVTFAVRQTDYVLPPLVGLRNPLHHVAAAGDHTVVVAFVVGSGNERGLYRDITSATADPIRIRFPATFRSTWTIEPGSETLFVTDKDDWWYATQADQDGAPAVTFMKSDGSRSTYRKPPELTSDDAQSHSWMMAAVAGEKPRVILFNYANEETVALDIDATGTKRSWRLPRFRFNNIPTVVAEPLSDGRIAVIENSRGLSLYLLADDGQFESIPLRNIEITRFGAAMGSGGRIAIAALRKDTGTMEAAVIDPAHTDHTEWQPLQHDLQIAGYGPRVVATPDGFVAAWVNDADRRRIEAAEIDRHGRWGPVVEIDRPMTHGQPYLDVQARNDELLFWWDDGGAHLFEHHLPASLKAYAAIKALRCAE